MTKIEQSIFYLIEDIGRLTKEAVEIKIGNTVRKYLPAKKVILSDSFFRKGICLQCGLCCRKIDTALFYTKVPLPELEKYFSLKVPVIVTHSIRKYVRIVYVLEKEKGCIFLEGDKCKIHPDKPLQCLIHPIHIDVINKSVYLKKRQYGRNHRFGCKIMFEDFSYDSLVRDIVFLKKLDESANDLGISTFLPDIIFYLEQNLQNYQKGEIPKDNIIIKE